MLSAILLHASEMKLQTTRKNRFGGKERIVENLGFQLFFRKKTFFFNKFWQNKNKIVILPKNILMLFMKEQKIRHIFLYKNYFSDFFKQQTQKVKDKILWTFRIIETLQIVPKEYLKHIEGQSGLYEIRVKQGSDIFRIFCFFDEEKLIIIENGFQKKTQKTPKNEIEKAIKIKSEYFNEK